MNELQLQRRIYDSYITPEEIDKLFKILLSQKINVDYIKYGEKKDE